MKIFGHIKKKQYFCSPFCALCAGGLEKLDVLDILEGLGDLETK